MLIAQQFTSGPQTCVYLPDRTATLEYSVAPILSPSEYEELMNSGCRKFGAAIFRPVCQGCEMCRPIRFSAAELKLDRSQQRTLKRNADLEVRFGAPRCDDERMDLFRRYHVWQHQTRDWPEHVDDREEYEFKFVHNAMPCTEISVWEGGVLRGVLISESTPNVVSAVYHYYEPECASRGLGTLLVLQTAELARREGRRWVYLGYYIAGCAGMEYKTRFRPSEVLGTDGVWRGVGELNAGAGVAQRDKGCASE